MCGFFVRPNAERQIADATGFSVGISETGKACTLRADLPGIKKEDIHIAIDADQVSVNAESRIEKDMEAK